MGLLRGGGEVVVGGERRELQVRERVPAREADDDLVAVLERAALVLVGEQEAERDLVVLGARAAALHLDELEHLEPPALDGDLLELLAVGERLRRLGHRPAGQDAQRREPQRRAVRLRRRQGERHTELRQRRLGAQKN